MAPERTTFAAAPFRITADDYGLSPSVNLAIEKLATAGAIDGVSVMCHRGAALDTIDVLLKTGVAIGLHLVFTHERPLVDGLAPLLSMEGRLPLGYARLFARLLLRPGNRALLAREAAAQAQRLTSLGARIGFLNSHEHVHLFPLLWPSVARLGEQLGVAAIRSAHAQPIAISRAGFLAASSRVSFRLRPWRGRTLVPLGVDDSRRMNAGSIARLVESGIRDPSPQRIAELVMHPSLDESDEGGRRREYELLASRELDPLLDRKPSSGRAMAAAT